MRQALALFGLVFGLAACGGAPLPARVAESDPPSRVADVPRAGVAEGVVPSRTATLTLERAAPQEVLVVAHMLLEEPVLVEATALASLRCIVVTVVDPTPVAPRVAAERLFAALRANGLRVEHARGAWVVGIDTAHPPPPCVEPAARGTAANDGRPEVQSGPGDAGEVDREARLQEVLRSITVISPTEHAVTRSGLDLLLGDQARLLGSTRVVPEQEGGKVVGIRLFGMPTDGFLSRIGFRNGDRLERVMGKPITNPDQALEAYAVMRSAKVIEIAIVRGGVAMKLIVRVR